MIDENEESKAAMLFRILMILGFAAGGGILGQKILPARLDCDETAENCFKDVGTISGGVFIGLFAGGVTAALILYIWQNINCSRPKTESAPTERTPLVRSDRSRDRDQSNLVSLSVFPPSEPPSYYSINADVVIRESARL
jgi:hypothetical protein